MLCSFRDLPGLWINRLNSITADGGPVAIPETRALGHLQLALAQILDSITQLRGLLEFETLGVRAHFKLQTFDRFVDLLPTVAVYVFQFQRHFEVVGLCRGHERRFDRFDDRR